MSTDTKTKPEEATEAAPDTAAEDAATVEGDGAEVAADSGSPSLVSRLGQAISGNALTVTGIAVFSAATLGGAVFFGGDITLDETTAQERDAEARLQEEQARPVEEEIDPSLTGDELVRMGETALEGGRVSAARRLLEEARTRVDSDQVNLRIDLFSALARAEELAGREDLSRLHRDYLGRLRESMGGSIGLFNDAELNYRRGKLREARRLYSRFLLRPGEMGEQGERYLKEARERLAQIMERQFATAAPDAMRMPLEPESYFDE